MGPTDLGLHHRPRTTETDRAIMSHHDRETAKEALRVAGRRVRAAIPAAVRSNAPDGLWRALRPLRLGVEAGVVAGFHPIGTEINVLPVLNAFADAGWSTCLPVTQGPNRPLLFRAWQPGDELEAGPHGVAIPPTSQAEVRPDQLLVPLLAFDRAGYRLGYGGGYYDRTLADLRAKGSRLWAVGVGFAEQEIAAVPTDPHDQPLDGIATPRALIVV